MSFLSLLPPAEASNHVGDARVSLGSNDSNGPLEQAARPDASLGHIQVSVDESTDQGTAYACVPDCFGSWCCLLECDCHCHEPETVFSEKTLQAPEASEVREGNGRRFNSQKSETLHPEWERDESIHSSSVALAEPGNAQASRDGVDREAVSDYRAVRELSRDTDGSALASDLEEGWPDCVYLGQRVLVTYTPQGDPVTVPLTCEGLSVKEWCQPCVAHRHTMLVKRYTKQPGHDAPRTSVVATLSEKADIEKYVECFVGVARRTDGGDVAYARPLCETKKGDYRVMVVFDRMLSDRAHELMLRKVRRWPTVEVRQQVITGDDFSGFLRKLRREGGANTTSWSHNWAKLEVHDRYLTAGGSISVPDEPVRRVHGPLYYHDWRRAGEPGSAEACELWVRDHVRELPDEGTLAEWGSGPRYRAKAAVRRWVVETEYTGNWKYLLHAGEAHTGLRAMRECYRPLLEGWKPEPGWFDAPPEEGTVYGWCYEDDFEVPEPGTWDLG